MEKDFYTDDFEQLLKDTTDDFRMYPSRKVWHSIYNDLHPARKWPSFAVCLLLITSILYVGIHNNNTINADADNLFLSTLSPVDNTDKDFIPVTATAKEGKRESPGSDYSNSVKLTKNNKENSVTNNFSLKQSNIVPVQNRSALPGNTDQGTAAAYIPEIVNDETKTITNTIEPLSGDLVVSAENTAVNDKTEVAINDLKQEQQVVISPDLNSEIIITPELSGMVTADAKSITSPSRSLPAPKTPNAEETIWIEDYAFHNKRNSNKWKTKLSTVVYFTPSVGYRILNKNNNFEPVNALLIRNSATSVDADDAISQQAALNMESGASVLVNLSKKLKVKAGIQISYTNYISYAQKLNHPTSTNLLLNDLNTGNTLLVPYSTIYGNKSGENITRLNNKTIQFSLPIGADYKLAGNDKLKWYIGATIQPTYVAGGNAYLVSSDYKNYIDMPSMLRSWNLNAGFESFISYKTKSGSYINLGPQFRYQLLSTYSNRYTYTENLYNIGIKVGIMRKL